MLPQPGGIAGRLTELEQQIDRDVTVLQSAARDCFVSVGLILTEIHDTGLYRQRADSFESYVLDRFGFSKRHANRLIAAAAVVHNLGTIGPEIATESQARELVGLEPDDAAEIMTRVLASGTVSAKAIRAQRELLPPPKPKPDPMLSYLFYCAMFEESERYGGVIFETSVLEHFNLTGVADGCDYPRMGRNQWLDFERDIVANGVQQPVLITPDRRVVDGLQRLIAAWFHKLPVEMSETTDEPVALSYLLNVVIPSGKTGALRIEQVRQDLHTVEAVIAADDEPAEIVASARERTDRIQSLIAEMEAWVASGDAPAHMVKSIFGTTDVRRFVCNMAGAIGGGR